MAEATILDLGLNTLDLYVIQGGKVEPRFVGGEKVGVRRLLEGLDPGGVEPEEMDDRLRTGRLRPSKEQLESWLGEVLAAIERVWPTLRLTLRPRRDDELIAMVLHAPKGALAGLVREAMRSGIPKEVGTCIESSNEPRLDMSSLGIDL